MQQAHLSGLTPLGLSAFTQTSPPSHLVAASPAPPQAHSSIGRLQGVFRTARSRIWSGGFLQALFGSEFYSLGIFAVVCPYTPFSADAAPLMNEVALPVLGEGGSYHAAKPAPLLCRGIRNRKGGDGPRKMTQADRAERYNAQIRRLAN